ARLQRPRQQREQRRLSRPVRPDQGQRLAPLQLQLDRSKRGRLAEGAPGPAGGEQRLRGAHRLAAAGGSAGGTGATAGACSTSTSTGIVPPSCHGSSVKRSPKNSQIARLAASSGSATSAPGSP